jgi:hypothetical protein
LNLSIFERYKQVPQLDTGWTTERSEYESWLGQGFSPLHVIHPTSYPMGIGSSDHSPPTNAEVKKSGSVHPLPPMPS